VKKPHGKGGRKGSASTDDEDIWHHTAATIEPLKRGKPRVHLTDAKEPAEVKPKTHSETPIAAKATPKRASEKLMEPARPEPASAARRTAPDLATFDRNSARKIRIGRIEIEARVDLHGLRQDEAHTMLRSFLFRSQSRGLRYVLVITGKGKTTSIFDRSSRDIERERGVLKRNVPRWLEEPDIRSIVVSYTTAAIHHGGEGAIYVHLRSKDRA
jgi:DNA-nicking Smr family endonuclease